jgi:hypothetical protein
VASTATAQDDERDARQGSQQDSAVVARTSDDTTPAASFVLALGGRYGARVLATVGTRGASV